MPGEYIKRQKPLPWTKWTRCISEFPDQRYQRNFRYRIVGYYSPDLEQIYTLDAKSCPIYESEMNIETVYLQEGRRKQIIESSRRVSFFHETMKAAAEYICLNCLFISTNRRCFACSSTNPKEVFKIERVLPRDLGFQTEFTYTKTGRFPEPLKEELMMATCDPDRKDLFKWIMDIDEIKDMDLS